MAESNRFPTIRERLRQISEYSLPYNFVAGNDLVNRNITPIGLPLEGRIYEVIVGPGRPEPFNFSKAGLDNKERLKKAEEGLAKASGGKFSSEIFGNDESLSWEYVELHGIYDPATDMTHYFVLPKMD